MKSINSFILLVALCILSISCSVQAEELKEDGLKVENYNEEDYEIFVPSNLNPNYKYPIIIGFSASGRGVEVLNIWEEAAKENDCIIIASNLVHNGKDIQKELKRINYDLHNSFSTKFPIDLKKVIAVGSSGGGMASHLFSFLYPKTIAAVISNVGYIHEKSLAQTKVYPRNKVCVLMTGTTDYNNKLIKEDYRFLTNHGWKCKLIEFIGGHVMAPKENRKEALKFVLENLEKIESINKN